MTETSRPRGEWWLLAGITLAALALRLWAIGDKGLAYDEAATALMARATAGEIVAFHWNAGFEHPPLWQLAMAAWSALFGQSEAMLRLLPALMGALAVPLAWLWVRRMWPGERALRLWTALLMALSPTLLLYSQEARMYTVVLALALLSLIALCAAVTRRRGWAIAGFVAANWIMTGFHYYSVLLIGVEGLFLLLLAARARSWRGALAGASITLFSLAPIALWMLLAPGFRATVGVIAGGIGSGAAPSALRFADSLWRDLSFGAIRWQPEIA
ncbi:MAG: glycosyltransferase family 39 protein, partial [Caldilineaceae bacterium]|nr:glycosyltransferase family 39 protein [Caldilineaceae bacterium]